MRQSEERKQGVKSGWPGGCCTAFAFVCLRTRPKDPSPQTRSSLSSRKSIAHMAEPLRNSFWPEGVAEGVTEAPPLPAVPPLTSPPLWALVPLPTVPPEARVAAVGEPVNAGAGALQTRGQAGRVSWEVQAAYCHAGSLTHKAAACLSRVR